MKNPVPVYEFVPDFDNDYMYKKTESILIKLSPNEKRLLSEIAHKRRISMGEMVRTLIVRMAIEDDIDIQPGKWE